MPTTDLPRCATCRHWGRGSTVVVDRAAWGSETWDVCGESSAGGPFDGMMLFPVTRSDFGCVLHEPREKP